jgi:hypothetical protein
VEHGTGVEPAGPAVPAAGRPLASASPAESIDPAAVQASFDRLSALFADMMLTVADISTRRCPYKDRTDHCTAKFGCRNQRKPSEPGGLRVCGGDDRLDYRSAWETT